MSRLRAVVVLLGLMPCAAAAWPAAWPYRKPVTVTNSTGAALAPYQVLLTFDSALLVSQGKLKSTCADLRVADTDGDTFVPYWIESGCNTANTRVWARVPALANGTSTLFLYYGNAAALAVSSGTATMDFFDDFVGAGVDLTKWNVVQKTAGQTAVRAGSGELQLELFGGQTWVGAGVHTETRYVFNKNSGLIVEWTQSRFHVKGVNCGAADCGQHAFWIRPNTGCGRDGNYGGPVCASSIQLFMGGDNTDFYSYLAGVGFSGGPVTYRVPGYPPATPMTIRLELSNTGQTRVYQNDVLRLDATVVPASWTALGTTTVFELYNGNYTAPLPTAYEGFRLFRARRWASTPPTTTVGSESAPCVGVTCTALDACHVAGVCDPGTGACTNPNAPNGQSCDDGDRCTTNDTCQAGACSSGAAVTCTALDPCHTAGSCDPATGACSNPAKANDAPCDDANACTMGESCQAGVCGAPAATVTCSPVDQCHVAGVCNPSNGTCSNPNAPNGRACDDGSACTTGESCQAGTCGAPVSTVTCAPLDGCHVAGLCQAATGVCTTPAKPDGAACSDGSACTTGETCRGGTCGAPVSTVTCTALDQCHTAGACDPATGACSNPSRGDGVSCNDANACTSGETCRSGVCGAPAAVVTCTALDRCHVAGACVPATGQCTNPDAPNGTSCDDGNGCSLGESCQAGVCGAPAAMKTCTALDACHLAGTCDPATGACSDPAKPDGTVCDDASACTAGEACHAGVCGQPATTVTCTAMDDCHVAGACSPATGTCTHPAKADGAQCDDSNRCTLGDACRQGVCVASSMVSCTAQSQCHDVGECDPATGSCSNPVKALGSLCDDGDACTQWEQCIDGVCGMPPARKKCPAPKACHQPGVCQSPGGECLEAPVADGSACDAGTCMAGACLPPEVVPMMMMMVDAGDGAGQGSCGCGAGGLTPLLALGALAWGLRRRRARSGSAA